MYASYVFRAEYTQARSVKIVVLLNYMRSKRTIRSRGSLKKRNTKGAHCRACSGFVLLRSLF